MFSSDYDLTSQVSNIDLLGAHWQFGLNARAGYLKQGEKVWRVMVLDIPLVLNDVYGQVA